MAEVHPFQPRFAKTLSVGLIIAVSICLSCGRGDSESKPGNVKKAEATARHSPKALPIPAASSALTPAKVEESKSAATTGHIPPTKVDLKKWLNEAKPIGVAACDQFFKSYRRCIKDHGPSSEVASDQIEKLQEQVEAWRSMIAGKPDSAKIIEVGCQAARASAQHTTSSWGCVWK